jgi:hypothetical protein
VTAEAVTAEAVTAEAVTAWAQNCQTRSCQAGQQIAGSGLPAGQLAARDQLAGQALPLDRVGVPALTTHRQGAPRFGYQPALGAAFGRDRRLALQARHRSEPDHHCPRPQRRPDHLLAQPPPSRQAYPLGTAAARRCLLQAPPLHKVIHPPRADYWIAPTPALWVVTQVVGRFPGVGVMALAAEPCVDAPVGAPPPAGAAAPELAQTALCFPGVARMAALSQPLVPFVDAPVGAPPSAGAAARELGPGPGSAQAAPRFPGVARMADLAQPIVPFAGVPAGAAVPEAAPAALGFPGVARMADLANPLVAA